MVLPKVLVLLLYKLAASACRRASYASTSTCVCAKGSVRDQDVLVRNVAFAQTKAGDGKGRVRAA